MILLTFVLLPIITGVFVYAVPKLPIKTVVYIAETTLLCALFYAFSTHTDSIRVVLGAKTSIMGILLIADTFSLTLIGLSIFLFFLIFIYTTKDSYFGKKFVMLFLILQGLLCGVFITDDLFNIYVLLEVATVVVAILIMFKRDSRSTYDGIVYLLSQIICMLFYLFGIGYMYKIFGVLSIEKIRDMMQFVEPSQLVLPFSLIMSAICLKSAFFPLFSWLPRAHGTPSAPSAVSAILSGLYVKNGIYLFYVFSGLFSPFISHSQYFTVIAALTAILGFILAIAQTDIKLMLAFSTISQIGLISIGLNVSNDISTAGALYHIISHAIFKALLFLTAGMIITQYKTRDIRNIKGVFNTMPITGLATILGILGITGAPFFNGSISKYFMQYGAKDTPIEYLFLIVNMGTVLCFTKYSRMLWGKGEEPIKRDRFKQSVVLVLGFSCLLGGIFGTNIINSIFNENLSVDVYSYAEKSIIYFIMLAFGFLFYKYVIKKYPVILKLNKLSFHFQQIMLAILLFFISTNVIMLLQFST